MLKSLSARSHDYVEAVRALGASPGRILLRTLLPNIAGPVLVQLSLAVAAAVVLESGLSFLGLGVVPPAPSWGLMIRGARATMEQAPLLLLWPCAALTLTILAMNLLCDALRDAVDPRTAGRAAETQRAVGPHAAGTSPVSSATPEAAFDAAFDLTVEIDTPARPIRPVEDVASACAQGETLAIVGESGSGKSLTATAHHGAAAAGARVLDGGTAWFEGTGSVASSASPKCASCAAVAIAMIFQDPMSSLNPVHRVGDQVIEAILAHQHLAESQAPRARRSIAISPRRDRRSGASPRAWPHEMSGGMRQRVMIAMAIANRPALLIADEPTTALDVTVQAQILDLLADLQRETGTAMVFITHSLSVVAEIADRVTVMYAGQIVEEGRVGDVFGAPLHPYTRALLDAAPEGDVAPAASTAWCRSRTPFRPAVASRRAAGMRGILLDGAVALEEARRDRLTRCMRWRELVARRTAA